MYILNSDFLKEGNITPDPSKYGTKSLTPLLELGGPVARANRLQVRKQESSRRQPTQNRLDVRAEVDHRETSGFLSGIGDRLIAPINVFAFQIRDVGLRATKMPAQLIKAASLGVFLPVDDLLMFIERDGAFRLKTNFWPQPFGDDGPR